MSLKLTLIKKIDKFNPKWSEYIKNLLIGKINHLPSSETQYEDETDRLDMNLDRCCIVGEVYGFRDINQDDHHCDACLSYGMALFDFANNMHLDEFQDKLEKFYGHVEFVHPELVPTKSRKNLA